MTLTMRLIHSVTEPKTNEKEKISIKNVKAFCDYANIEYYQVIMGLHKELPPKDSCFRPQHISFEPKDLGNGIGHLTPAHYGNYLAHKIPIFIEDNKNYDLIFILEGDAFIDVDFEEFANSIGRFYKIAIEQDLSIIGLANPYLSVDNKDYLVEDVYCNTKYFMEGQGELIPCSKLDAWKNEIETKKWDVWDLFVTNIVTLKKGVTNKKYIKEIAGKSTLNGWIEGDPVKLKNGQYASEEKVKLYR